MSNERADKWLESGEIITSSFEEAHRRVLVKVALRVLALLLVVGAVGFLLQPLFAPPEEKAHGRSTFNSRADGFRGVFAVLRDLGVTMRRHTSSYARLPDPKDSVLVVLDPIPSWILERRFPGVRIDEAQEREVREWVEHGGRAILAPPGRVAVRIFGRDVHIESDRDFAGGIWWNFFGERKWAVATGAVRGRLDLEGFRDTWATPPYRGAALAAFVKDPGLESVVWRARRVDGTSNIDLRREAARATSESSEVQVRVFAGSGDGDVVLTLEGQPLVIADDIGDGRVWTFSTSYPFANLALARCRTAHAIADLIEAASDEGRRTVYFDEYCHGRRTSRGLFGWILSTRLAFPVAGILVVVVLLLWRGAVRFGEPDALGKMARRSKEEYVAHLADIALRADKYGLASKWIVDWYRIRLLKAGERGVGEAAVDHGVPALERLRQSAKSIRDEGELRAVAKRAAKVYRRTKRGKHK